MLQPRQSAGFVQRVFSEICILGSSSCDTRIDTVLSTLKTFLLPKRKGKRRGENCSSYSWCRNLVQRFKYNDVCAEAYFHPWMWTHTSMDTRYCSRSLRKRQGVECHSALNVAVSEEFSRHSHIWF